MKLFVWNDPYAVRYGGSIIYAVAETVEEARTAIKSARTSKFGLLPGERGYFDIGTAEPTRVLDAPCAEIYEWKE
jgi:hypothetical protein